MLLHKKTISDIRYKTISCQSLTDNELKQCKDLFDAHYGTWGEGSPRKGKRINFPLRNYEEYRKLKNTFVALAILDDKVIGQAFYLKDIFGKNDQISWVLQLVVHEDHRKQGIAKTLLYSIWGFSGDYAWGLATSNALTVKTLEKATFRKADPKEMLKHSARIVMIKNKVPFAADAKMRLTNEQAILDSGFPVDRDVIAQNLRLYDGKWELGELPIGHEWLAFTFRDQKYSISKHDYDEMFRNSEKIINEAYSRMDLPLQSWNKHQEAEVDVILQTLNDPGIHSVIDFGCGNGRHTLEFAQRGYEAIGIDYSDRNIEQINKNPELFGASFFKDDCRTVDLRKKADLALCLYDVVGSFVNKSDNLKILKTIRNHLKAKGYLVISVMNLELTKSIAQNIVDDVRSNPNALVRLPPSKIMKTSGNVFNPEFFLLESRTGVVYRKEQFENDGSLSAEYVIRDKRFSKAEICGLLKKAGFDILESRYVQAGKWDTSLKSNDLKAKEVLVFAQKKGAF